MKHEGLIEAIRNAQTAHDREEERRLVVGDTSESMDTADALWRAYREYAEWQMEQQ